MVTVLYRQRHGYDVVVYPKDHEPAHVHVFRGDNEVLIDIQDWTVISNFGFTSREIRKIVHLLQEHVALLRATWDRYPGSQPG